MNSSFGSRVGALTRLDVNRSLYEAARDGKVEDVERLLNGDPPPELESEHDGPRTALDQASGNNHVEIMRHLVEKGKAKVSPRALRIAVDLRAIGAVEYLIAFSMDKMNYVNSRFGTGWTPLHIACNDREASLELLEILVGAGCRIDEQNDEGNTCLHVASEWDDGASVLWLLDHGANASETNIRKETALEVAEGRSSFGAIGAFAIKETDDANDMAPSGIPTRASERDVIKFSGSLLVAGSEWRHIVRGNSVSRKHIRNVNCDFADRRE